MKEERVARALSLQSKIGIEKQKLLIGQKLKVMIDGRSAEDNSLLLARSAMQAPEVDGYVRLRDDDAKNGDFLQVEITGFDGYDLVGKNLNR
ncbi:MAG: hypothetical protein ACYCXI_07885 [Dethiobacteraceae bacterium]